MWISDKRSIRTQEPVAEETGERKHSAIAQSPDTAAHSVWIKLHRLQANYRQLRGPKQAMNHDGLRGKRISSNGEWCGADDDGEREKGQPRKNTATVPDHAYCDAETEDGGQ